MAQETKFKALYNGKSAIVTGRDLWDAKKQAIAALRVPKSKQGLLSIMAVQLPDGSDIVHVADF